MQNESNKNIFIIENIKKDLSLPNKTKNKEMKYINLCFCHLSIGIIFTYIFIVCSIILNVVNRIIFWKYKFEFNITLIFLQQLFCMIFFIILSKQSKLFNKETGIVSDIVYFL